MSHEGLIATTTRVGRLARCSEWLGVASLGLFAFSIASATAGIYLGLAGMVLALSGVAREFWSWATTRAVFWPAVALSVWILVRSSAGSPYDIPDHASADAARDLLRLAGVQALVVGWWMFRARDRWPLICTLAAAGLLVNVALHFHWSDPSSYLAAAHRSGFGLGGGNAPSVYGAVLIIGCLTLGRALLDRPRVPDRGSAVCPWVSWGVLMGLGVFLLMVGQSRSVWLAAVVVAGLLAAVALWRHGPGGVLEAIRVRPRLALAALVTTLAVLALFSPLVLERLARESLAWHALFALDFEQMPSTSIGYRVAQWRIAFEEIAAHPFVGVGPGAAEVVMALTNDPILGQKTFPHFHNVYLEVAVSLGLVGLLLFLAVIGGLAWSAFRGLQAAAGMQRALARFAVVSGLLIAAISMLQIRYDDPPGMALFVFLSACALACDGAREAQETQAASAGATASGHSGTRRP